MTWLRNNFQSQRLQNNYKSKFEDIVKFKFQYNEHKRRPGFDFDVLIILIAFQLHHFM